MVEARKNHRRCNKFYFEQDDGMHEPPMKSKMVGIKLKQGQVVRLETPGGGGYGDVAKRSKQRIEQDQQLGYVNAASTDGGAS